MNAKHYYLSVLLLLVATLGLRAQSKTVTLTEAGTLSNFISEAELTTITDLTITGPVNSADILTIRSMSGNLQVLNLLDANIVYSEDSYYGTGSNACHTQNDVIGSYMFYGMAFLKKVTLPKNVWSIGSWDRDDPWWNEEKTTIQGNPKSTSEAYTFARCVNLEEVVLPGSLLWIGGRAFEYCTALHTISLPEGLIGIGSYAFSECRAMTDITIPVSLGQNTKFEWFLNDDSYFTDYHGGIFNNCVNLSNVVLPAGLRGLPQEMFYGCTALKSITLPEELLYMASAFSGCSALEAINIPNGVVSIGNFRDCSSLKEIVIPDGITKLDGETFSGCISLAKVTLPSNLEDIPERLFYGCPSLTSVVIPESVMTIGNYAFSECTSLETLTLPSRILKMGYGVFENCTSLKNVTLPSALTEIGSSMFRNCAQLVSIHLPSSLIDIPEYTFSYCTSLENIDLPTGLMTIGNYAFENCESLKSIDIPVELQSMGTNVFISCKKLETVTFPASMKNIGGLRYSGIKTIKFAEGAAPESIENEAFYECDSLRSVTLPSTITSIGDRAFAYCDSLKTVVFPDGLKEIGNEAFRDCLSLTISSLPASLTTVDSYAFLQVKFPSLTIPAGLTSIPNDAFYGAVFNELTVPATVASIDRNAFGNAEITGKLTITPATNLTLGQNAFNCSGNRSDADGNWYNYHLNTVEWNSTSIFPKDKFCEIDYLYLPEGGKTNSESNIGYIFYDGITDSIAISTDYNNGISYFEVKQPIKGRKITYQKSFYVTSGYGEAAGWKTLVLPFTVTKITHTRGYGESQETVTLAPFGSTALGTEGVLPFWLYELGTDGNYKAATAIEAHKPYLICMPNNDAYPNENNINGDVLFIAEDATNGVTLGVTEGVLSPSTGVKFDLVPTYKTVPHSLNVYALNEDGWYYVDNKSYPAGSVFIQDYEDIQPFEAYLVSKEAQAGTLNATRYYAIGGGDGTITGIEDGPAMPDQATRAYSRGGVLYIQTNADRTIYIYNVQGQTVRIVNAHEGLNEVRGLEEGIYMLEGQKVVVK